MACFVIFAGAVFYSYARQCNIIATSKEVEPDQSSSAARPLQTVFTVPVATASRRRRRRRLRATSRLPLFDYNSFPHVLEKHVLPYCDNTTFLALRSTCKRLRLCADRLEAFHIAISPGSDEDAKQRNALVCARISPADRRRCPTFKECRITARVTNDSEQCTVTWEQGRILLQRTRVIDLIGSVPFKAMALRPHQCPLLHTIRYRPTTVGSFILPSLTAPTVVVFDTLHAAQPYDKTFRKVQVHAIPSPFLSPVPVTKLVVNLSYNGGRVWPSLRFQANRSLSAVVLISTNPMPPMTTTLDPVIHAVVIRHTAPLLQDIATGIRCRIDDHCPTLTITLVDSHTVHPLCFGPAVEDNRSKGNAAMALAIRQQGPATPVRVWCVW